MANRKREHEISITSGKRSINGKGWGGVVAVTIIVIVALAVMATGARVW
jgi:hypothetical protein